MITKSSILKKEIEQIDIEKIKDFEDLLTSYKNASIQARNLGKCFDVYKKMIKDKDVTIIMGLAGALIAGGLRKVIVSMIKNKIVDVIVSTGAILYQDFYQARGYKHYVGTPFANDKILNKFFIDRIYDTYVDEEKFRETDRYIAKIAENLIKNNNKVYSTREFIKILGNNINDENSIIYNANKNNIPIFCPAINDSSIGIGLSKFYANNKKQIIDPIKDFYELALIKGNSKKTGVIYIGGGTPKNYINDCVIAAQELNFNVDGHEYGFQITTDAPHWGGLSGSTIEEAQSWGKISKNAKKATVYSEATIALPLIVKGILEWMKKRKIKRENKKFEFLENYL